MRSRPRSRHPTAFAAVLVGVAAACSDPTGVPTSDRVVYSPTDTLFASIAVSTGHSCALTRGGRAFCWGSNTSGQLGTTAVDGNCANTYVRGACATVPAPVNAGIRFKQIAVTSDATCGLTPSGQAYCWGGGSPVPARVPGAPTFRAIGATRDIDDVYCGLDGGGGAWCWAPNAPADSLASARPVPRGLRFTELGDRCGMRDGRTVYCWGETVDTTVFDRESVTLNSCVVGGSRDAVYYAPCSPSPVRLRGASALAHLGAGARDCALDPTGAVFCWGGRVPGYVLGRPGEFVNEYSSGRLPEHLAFPVPFVRLLEASPGTICGQGADGTLFCRGYSDGGLFGTGVEYESTTGPVLVAGGLHFAAADVSGNSACGVTPDGAAYCWGYGVNGQLGIGTVLPDACFGSTVTAAQPICAFRPQRVASIAGLR